MSSRLKVDVKNVLKNQRSSLEYLARALTAAFGNPGAKVNYPLAPEASKFKSSIERLMPGVAAARPNIASAIERHQPYQPGHTWLEHLRDLTNENKHQRLTPQTRTESRCIDVKLPAGGGVSYAPYEPGRGGVQFGPGVSIAGVPVDPVTQRPVPSRTQTVEETIYVDWLFEDLSVSVLGTLHDIQDNLKSTVEEILGIAGL